MTVLFSLLSFLCLIALVIGLIRPSIVIGRKNRKLSSLIYGAGFIVSLILVGATAPKTTAVVANNNSANSSPPSSNSTQDVASTATKSPKKTTNKTAHATSTSTPTPWSKQVVNKEDVTNALQHLNSMTLTTDPNFPKDVMKIEVIANKSGSGGEIINIYYKPGTVWNETDFVKQSIGTGLETFKTLFTNKNVHSVTMYSMTDMTDQYGKNSTEDGMRLEYDRATIAQIGWSGFENRVLVQPSDALSVATEYYIYPGIFKNVKLKDLFYASGGTGK